MIHISTIPTAKPVNDVGTRLYDRIKPLNQWHILVGLEQYSRGASAKRYIRSVVVRVIMGRNVYTNIGLYGSLVVFCIYVLNVLYERFTDIQGATPFNESIGMFLGMDGPAQFVLLLIMSALFTMAIVSSRRTTVEERKSTEPNNS